MRALVLVVALGLAPVLAAAQETEAEVASKEPGAAAEVVFTGLSAPVDIAFAPDGTLYYAAFMSGELRAVRAEGEETVWTAPDLQGGGERGFVGLAVDPASEDEPIFYVFYQTNKSGTVVSRFSRVVAGEEEVLLDDLRSGLLHNSGRIAFTPEGHILLSVGDAVLDTAGRRASMHAHDPQVLNGKVLRLTRDGDAAPGNPWGNEVWTKGHRNVYGLAVSPDGVVIGTENGPESWDEVNVLEAGKDYGWPTCSGACGQEGHVDPVLAYEDTIAPTGAVWYEGAFYFTDFNKGSIHRIYELPNGSWADERVLKFTTPRILDIAIGPDGLYVSTWDSVWRVTVAPDRMRPATPTAPTGGGEDVDPPTPSGAGEPTTPTGVGGPAEVGGAGVPAVGVWAVAAYAAAAWLRGRR